MVPPQVEDQTALLSRFAPGWSLVVAVLAVDACDAGSVPSVPGSRGTRQEASTSDESTNVGMLKG